MILIYHRVRKGHLFYRLTGTAYLYNGCSANLTGPPKRENTVNSQQSQLRSRATME